MVLALLKRALAIACALVTIALTAGLSPQTIAVHRAPAAAEGAPTPGPDDVAISAELARYGILARSGRPFTASTLGQLVRQGSLADSLAS